MTHIMFVCHGNICRSPMAEFVFKKICEENGASNRYRVASSATSTEEIFGGVGNPVYPPIREILEKTGIDCSKKRAVKLQAEDYEKYDLIVAMDGNNVRNIMRIIGSDPYRKVSKLLSFSGDPSDVSDPWYTRDFETCRRDILKGCNALFEFCEAEARKADSERRL